MSKYKIYEVTIEECRTDYDAKTILFEKSRSAKGAIYNVLKRIDNETRTQLTIKVEEIRE